MGLLQEKMVAVSALVNPMLESLIPVEDLPQREVLEAMRYSVEAGGKRIRPFLVLETAQMLGRKPDPGIVACACAVEMIHTYSLIHDDLPCMDDDDMRRGKPSCHIQFGEATALLAGDALLTQAFEVLAGAWGLSDAQRVRCIQALSHAAGTRGMLGGQVIDLQSESREIPNQLLHQLCQLKTGALIRVSGHMGCICADASEEQMEAVDRYCQNIGLVFQIVDDILDVCGDEAALGKKTGSDQANGKSTFVTHYGLEGAKDYAAELTGQAVSALEMFGEQGEVLRELAQMLLFRQH